MSGLHFYHSLLLAQKRKRKEKLRLKLKERRELKRMVKLLVWNTVRDTHNCIVRLTAIVGCF